MSFQENKKTNKKTDAKLPVYKKYAKGTSTYLDPNTKLKPSDLSQSVVNVVADDYPMIIEFVNMLDNTSQVKSAVDIDLPLFQVSPTVIVLKIMHHLLFMRKKSFFVMLILLQEGLKY